MTVLSRRTILQAGAGAAVAVPMTVLATRVAAADRVIAGTPGPEAFSADGSTAAHPVMFCVHDAATGEVSILHGTGEVVVRDKKLVSTILAAAAATPPSSVVTSTAPGA